jgi:hypothetical protein
MLINLFQVVFIITGQMVHAQDMNGLDIIIKAKHHNRQMGCSGNRIKTAADFFGALREPSGAMPT